MIANARSYELQQQEQMGPKMTQMAGAFSSRPFDVQMAGPTSGLREPAKYGEDVRENVATTSPGSELLCAALGERKFWSWRDGSPFCCEEVGEMKGGDAEV